MIEVFLAVCLEVTAHPASSPSCQPWTRRTLPSRFLAGAFQETGTQCWWQVPTFESMRSGL